MGFLGMQRAWKKGYPARTATVRATVGKLCDGGGASPVEVVELMDRGGRKPAFRRGARWRVGLLLAVCALGAVAHAEPPDEPPAGAIKEGAAPAEPEARGDVVEIWVDRASGVTSAWLSNGVLFHHKHLKASKGPVEGAQARDTPRDEGRRRERPIPEVAVCVTIAGAELLESSENRGVSDAAVASAWTSRSVRSMKPKELAAFLDASGVAVRCHGGADSFMLTATGEGASIEAGLRGVRLMLAEPVVDEDELMRWKERTIRQIEERKKAGNDAFDGVIASLFGPREARARRPRAESIRAVSAAQAQAWLDVALGTEPDGAGKKGAGGMPMEVAIVGDIAVDRAIVLAEKYFGSLPARARMTEETLADRRVATRAERPPEVLALEHWDGNPLVLVGFFGTDIRNIAEHRALTVAAKILSARLDRLPPEQNDGEQAFALSMPASVYPGFGLFLASTHAREGNEAGASENIRKLLDDLMVSGPGEEELSRAARELSASAGRMLSDPVYWARTLSRSAYHGFPVAEIGRAEGVYREMPAAAITEVLHKYATPERSIRLIVKPGGDRGEGAGSSSLDE